MGHEHEIAAIEAAHIPAREMYIRATREGRDFEATMAGAREFWTEYNDLVLVGLGLEDESLARVSEAVYTVAWSAESWQAFPDAIPALQDLRDMGIMMAVVSNFVDTLPALCQRSGISDLIDVVVASVDAGAMKPDARIWTMALRRLGVQPEHAWHVGDNYWSDVMGARAAGLTPVLLDRGGLVPHPDCARVGGLDELVAMIRPLEEEEAAA